MSPEDERRRDEDGKALEEAVSELLAGRDSIETRA
jgi:hypothetical protein